jgi:hypothetical protein
MSQRQAFVAGAVHHKVSAERKIYAMDLSGRPFGWNGHFSA